MRIILTIIFLTFSIPIVCGQNIPYPNHPYNVPPRLFHNCMDSYIGNEYSEARRPSCERLWGQWTRELLLEETQYFSNL